MSPAPSSSWDPLLDDAEAADEEKPDWPRLIRLSAESKASANEALADGRLDRAAELYVRGVHRLEGIDLQEHADAKPLKLALLLNLSLCRLRMDEPRRAHNAATRALAIDPRSE